MALEAKHKRDMCASRTKTAMDQWEDNQITKMQNVSKAYMKDLFVLMNLFVQKRGEKNIARIVNAAPVTGRVPKVY